MNLTSSLVSESSNQDLMQEDLVQLSNMVTQTVNQLDSSNANTQVITVSLYCIQCDIYFSYSFWNYILYFMISACTKSNTFIPPPTPLPPLYVTCII